MFANWYDSTCLAKLSLGGFTCTHLTTVVWYFEIMWFILLAIWFDRYSLIVSVLLALIGIWQSSVVWCVPFLPALGVWQLCGDCDDWWRAVHTRPVRHGRPGGLRPVATAQLPTDRRIPCLLLCRITIVIRECQRKGNIKPLKCQNFATILLIDNTWISFLHLIHQSTGVARCCDQMVPWILKPSRPPVGFGRLLI